MDSFYMRYRSSVWYRDTWEAETVSLSRLQFQRSHNTAANVTNVSFHKFACALWYADRNERAYDVMHQSLNSGTLLEASETCRVVNLDVTGAPDL